MDAVDGKHSGDVRQFIAFSSTPHNPDKPEFHSLYLIRTDGTDLRRIYVAGGEWSDEVDMERATSALNLNVWKLYGYGSLLSSLGKRPLKGNRVDILKELLQCMPQAIDIVLWMEGDYSRTCV
ncbi:hypothetical protein Syun_030866 [Stephania yunnanensis]|uniref:Uncharacterized protein n=1 Tax=Stephania yunnanensis TaxID=152371 RepID=A0AAP0DZH8_9MAGN